MISRGGSTISWYSYNQPNQINQGSNSTQFSYNANHQRWKQVAVDGTGTTTTWYVGGIMEKLSRPGGVIEYRHFIPAGSGTAIYMRKPDGTNATTYLTTDHLGSGDLILDSAGTVLAKESFTAFGARRGSNWQGVPSSADYTTFANKTRRGFTGHEMLDAVGLVNMNGRVYDPLIGRFLSADPIIQTINLSQALNPYSYVMNMPLTLIDPSGYSWLSKLFHHIGHFFKKALKIVLFGVIGLLPDKWFKIIASLELAILLPELGPLFQGFWGTVLTGAISGGVATGSLKGAIAGAVMAGAFFGLGRAVHAISNSLTKLPEFAAAGPLSPEAAAAYTGQTLDEVTVWGNRMTWLERRMYDLSHYAVAFWSCPASVDRLVSQSCDLVFSRLVDLTRQ